MRAKKKKLPLPRFQLFLLPVWLLLPGWLLFAGCHKSPSALSAAPTIVGFSPAQAHFGATLVIEGRNFSTTAADNRIQLNGVEALVTSATATKLTVVVPKNKACSGPITLTAGNQTTASPAPFHYVATAVVTTFVGGTQGAADGVGSAAQLSGPSGLAIDALDNLYVADLWNHRIRKVTPEGVVSTLAGSTEGAADGAGSAAQFREPCGLAIDTSGNLYVTELNSYRIRKVTPQGVVSTLSQETSADEHFYGQPCGIAIDASGNLYVSDVIMPGPHNYKPHIRKVTPQGISSTFVGGTIGRADGVGSAAQLGIPSDIVIDSANNLYVAEAGGRIRKVTPQGVVTTLAGSDRGVVDGQGGAARFGEPGGITIDAEGNLYVADLWKNSIRKVTPEGVVSTLSSTAKGYAEDTLMKLESIAIDSAGNLYVTELKNDRIQKITFE